MVVCSCADGVSVGKYLGEEFWVVEGARVLTGDAKLPVGVAATVYILRMPPSLIPSDLPQFSRLLGENGFLFLVCFPVIMGKVDYDCLCFL